MFIYLNFENIVRNIFPNVFTMVINSFCNRYLINNWYHINIGHIRIFCVCVFVVYLRHLKTCYYVISVRESKTKQNKLHNIINIIHITSYVSACFWYYIRFPFILFTGIVLCQCCHSVCDCLLLIIVSLFSKNRLIA